MKFFASIMERIYLQWYLELQLHQHEESSMTADWMSQHHKRDEIKPILVRLKVSFEAQMVILLI